MSNKAVYTDLLNTYHPRESFATGSALAQAFKFAILAGVWIAIVHGAGAGAGVTFAWLLPKLLLQVLPESGLLPAGTDMGLIEQIAQISAFLAPTVVIATIIPVNALFMVLCERKFLALLTVRKGPEAVGPNGFLQTLADALKLLFKEDISPKGSDKLLATLAPALFFAPSMVVFMPLLSVATRNTGIFVTTSMDIGLIFIMAFLSLGTMSLVMAGWASNNKYSLIGGFRASAQAISYEIPLVLTIIAMVLISGSTNLMTISETQAGGLLNWNVFGNGLMPRISQMMGYVDGSFFDGLFALIFVGISMFLFLIFVVASTAEVNRIPFDLPEAESELVSGYNTEFTGMKFALFFLAEYTNLFIGSAVASILFLGGYHLPISFEAEASIYQFLGDITIQFPIVGDLNGFLAHLDLGWALSSAVLMGKIYLMFLLAIWIRATLPRLRQDQLMEFGWKYLIPLTLGIIFIVALLVEYFNFG